MTFRPEKTAMPMQKPEVRIHNFEEVALGYTRELAVCEAQRCLDCKNRPCVSGCPVNIAIPDFIREIKSGNFEKAYSIIEENSSLSAICGRVCPQESQCESKCTLGIKFQPVAIGRLERFVSDYHNANSEIKSASMLKSGVEVAVVGSGPSGLACAAELTKRGYGVTVFEALHKAGGVLVYGIPEFRLPKSIVEKEIENLKSNGVKFETNVVVGKTLTVDELFERGFKAIYLGTGAGLPRFTGIKGEGLNGVYSANEYLTRSNLMKAYDAQSATPIIRAKKVAVIGGGNVAMDAARTALRLGAEEVYIVYRRSIEELPARREEVEHAQEEGIKFELLRAPVEIRGENNFVSGLIVRKCSLGEPDERGRRKPVEIPDSDYEIKVDCVVLAIGTSPNPLIRSTTPDISVAPNGCIIVDESTCKTSKEGVYAGGDAVTGAATVILAMGAGKTAAKAIDEYLSNTNN